MAASLVDLTGAPMRGAISPPSARRVNPMTLVRDVSGIPQPPSDVLERLRQWEPALGLKYHAVQWAFTWTWKADDPRRQWIREGKYGEQDAYDIIGYIPIDCSVDAIPAYAVTALKCYPRDEVQKLVESVGRYNAIDVAKEQTNAVLNTVLGGTDLGKDVTANSGQVSVPDALTTTPAPVTKQRRKHRRTKPIDKALP